MRCHRLRVLAVTTASALTLVTCGGSTPTAPGALPAISHGALVPAAALGGAASSEGWLYYATAASAEACTAGTITSVGIGANLASPRLEIDPVFDPTPAPFEVEVERLKNGTWFPWAQKASTGVHSRVEVEVWFNQTYRVRVRVIGCAWGEWIQKVVGRSNPCGHCGTGGTQGTITLGGSIN